MTINVPPRTWITSKLERQNGVYVIRTKSLAWDDTCVQGGLPAWC